MGCFRSEYVKCGKENCHKCPHGPYWYEYWREGKATKKKYWGKTRPEETRPAPGDQAAKDLDRIFDRTKATTELACRIIGISEDTNHQLAKKVFRAESLKRHPDRGGDTKDFARLSAAWSYLCAARGWK